MRVGLIVLGKLSRQQIGLDLGGSDVEVNVAVVLEDILVVVVPQDMIIIGVIDAKVLGVYNAADLGRSLVS